MFLIQGQGKAILYTGDVRAESWWVNSIVRNPTLIPYTLGKDRLDKIYLDTTFAGTSCMYRELPSKADGLRELLDKVSKYPPNTTFHFEAWTFGYEDVWVALAAYFNTPIHLDDYRWGLYRSLGAIDGSLPQAIEAAPLVGFHLGNHSRDGCLTPSPNGRIHSCERGAGCPKVDGAADVVRIFPIVKRLPDGAEVAEMGLGGGKGDLDQAHELEAPDPFILTRLKDFLSNEVNDALVARIMQRINVALEKGNGSLRLDAGLDVLQGEATLDGIPLQMLVNILARLAGDEGQPSPQTDASAASETDCETDLPRIITFPYARHASYAELCELVEAFKPKDLYPCTVDASTWTPQVSMKELFGNLCSSNVFAHDAYMMALPEVRERLEAESAQVETQRTDLGQCVDDDTTMLDATAPELDLSNQQHTNFNVETRRQNNTYWPETTPGLTIAPAPSSSNVHASGLDSERSTSPVEPSTEEWAWRAAKQVHGFTWTDFGGLVSTRKGAEEAEVEL